jgi:hypothetical protein
MYTHKTRAVDFIKEYINKTRMHDPKPHEYFTTLDQLNDKSPDQIPSAQSQWALN